MAHKYIVLGRTTDNRFETVADPSVEFGEQKQALTKQARNKKFAEVQMFMLMPHTRAYHPAATLKMEEDIAKSEKAAADKNKNPDGSDPKKGPTVQEFVAAGYDPKNYPPQGFNSRSTPEEIKKAIEDFKAPPANEFTRAELSGQNHNSLLKLATELVAAGRIAQPAKTSKGALIEAILAATPIVSANV